MSPTHELSAAMDRAQNIISAVTIADVDDARHPLIYANQAFTKLTGYDHKEVIGKNCRFLQCSETDPESISMISRAISGKNPISIVLKNAKIDGDTFDNLLILSPIRARSGKIFYLGCQYEIKLESLDRNVIPHLNQARGLIRLVGKFGNNRFRQTLNAIHMRSESVKMMIDLYLRPQIPR